MGLEICFWLHWNRLSCYKIYWAPRTTLQKYYRFSGFFDDHFDLFYCGSIDEKMIDINMVLLQILNQTKNLFIVRIRFLSLVFSFFFRVISCE